MRIINDIGYGQLSNPNCLHKLALMCGGNHRELLFSNVSTIFAKDFIVSHSFSQTPQILKGDVSILTTQSHSRTSYHI